jgi:pSer/pThr/pTyr-binding forkhead associated (FHA) protein
MPTPEDAAAQQTSDLPIGFRLRIEAIGHEASYAEMNKESIGIGRDPDNDIVLPVEGISTHNTRVRWSSDQWQVEDMGGINGTTLNGRQMRPGEIAEIKANSEIIIGPYFLVVEFEGQSILPAAPIEGAIISVDEDSLHEPPEDLPIELLLVQEDLLVQPGHETVLQIVVSNKGGFDDRVSPRIKGIPTEWVESPESSFKVASGEMITIPLVISPPRRLDTTSGRHRIRVELESEQYKGALYAAQTTLNLDSFESIEMTMKPRTLGLPGSVVVVVSNIGNSDFSFSVSGKNPDELVTFKGGRDRVTLGPGQSETIELQLSPQKRSLIGSRKESSFSVEVSTANETRKSSRGKASIGPIIPPTIVYLLLFLLSFVCVLSGLFVLVPRSENEASIALDTMGIDGQDGTSASIADALARESAAVVAAQETVHSAAAITSGDQDGDGLTDIQEEYIGTDISNPDTDQDQLNDGEELLTWSTNPSNRDTDGDQLSDGEEVHTFLTNPTVPDSDGDGVIDGDEVVYGTDPLEPNAPPTAAAILTPDPAGPTFSAEMSEDPESLSSPETPSFIPSVIPSTTPPPSYTPTDAPTATATPTPTETPVPALQIACVTSRPILDGLITTQEWGDQPMLEFTVSQDDDRSIALYGVHDLERLYFSVIIEDPIWNPDADAVNLYFDTNNSSGDPDVTDRILQVDRNGYITQWSGIGDSSEGGEWQPRPLSGSWYGIAAGTGLNAWVVEMEVFKPTEMPDLLSGASLGMMIRALLADGEGTWPQEASDVDLGSWQQVVLDPC